MHYKKWLYFKHKKWLYIFDNTCGYNKYMFLLFVVPLLAGNIRYRDQTYELDEDEVFHDFEYDKPKNKKVKCKFPNTTRDKSENKCVCVDDYIGDPNSPEGCFKCPNGCNERSICIFPGKCVCSYGYILDDDNNENFECIEPNAKILSVTFSEKIRNHAQIVYETNPDFEPSFALCKYNGVVVTAMLEKNNSILCDLSHIPKSQNLVIEMSFNGKEWSNSYQFKYDRIENDKIEVSQQNITDDKHQTKLVLNNYQVIIFSIGVAIISVICSF
ncbi:hypothetical protein TRFO_15286 [Tritrichomonas foetus]|uniref:Uncharacterized protein n=1 Tax=Tritrichomonas foetus TaxID=1144522 RepID=A0A1J4KXD2_9EUKA|nr:hypothetical protein TRFO_15286 [Tritrichomonas foetus]|eukprot:OHT14366.1 hypothetical protein TRFO_15286 [Tritrichomonas foetus]